MLSVGIKLNSIIIIMLMRVTHARLKRARQAQIHRQINHVITMLSTNIEGIVLGSIVDNNVINAWRVDS